MATINTHYSKQDGERRGQQNLLVWSAQQLIDPYKTEIVVLIKGGSEPLATNFFVWQIISNSGVNEKSQKRGGWEEATV